MQEAEPHVARAAVTATPSVPLTSTKTDNTMTPKSRSLGARLLQGWSKSAILATVKSSKLLTLFRLSACTCLASFRLSLQDKRANELLST